MGMGNMQYTNDGLIYLNRYFEELLSAIQFLYNLQNNLHEIRTLRKPCNFIYPQELFLNVLPVQRHLFDSFIAVAS